ncbi:APC family permease [Amphritea sp. 1_MG-2023]|uniref:APC family permease n=1 Tax=Amphritea sp. 1_MG-2023 TaxID=3062670 RepID=UPI0026E1581A|nr:APC family permease [Amphritea sp. 1_MG-2023]MDO6563390.1 APC family permease [Amphritea sp. 1_MG-2023]
MHHKYKVLGFKDVTLYTVSAMLFMDQIALAASLGATSMFWWGYVLIFLFIPMAMISSELGTTYPKNGGVYQWVRTAFGYRWGARISWLYWITNATWMPTVYILFAGMLSELFFPGLSLWQQVFIGIALSIFTAIFNIVSLKMGKWLPNLGAVLKIICVLAIGIAGINYGMANGFANVLTWETMVPTSGLEIAALGIMVYGVMGTELACSSADEMKNPTRDIPRAILASSLIVAAFNIFGTLGVLAAVPIEQTEITQIFVHSLYNLYGDTGFGYLFATLIACFVIFTLFTNMVTWSMGTNRAAIEAADEGELPRVFGIVHSKYQTPLGSALLAAAVSSASLLIYSLMANTAEDLFWSLMSFSAMIFLMPYVAMVLAFIKLRLTDNTERPFRMPVSNSVAVVIAGFVVLNIIGGIVMFVYIPGEPIDWTFTLQVLGGIASSLIVGELIIRYCEKKKNTITKHEEALQPSN